MSVETNHVMIDRAGYEYTVKNNPEWFYKALQKAHTLANDYVRVIPNVTKDVHIKKLVMDNMSVSQADPRDCSWTPLKRFSFDGADFTVDNYKINEEQCLNDLDAIYSEMTYSMGANKTEWPKIDGEGESLEEAIMFHLRNSLSNDIEHIIWGGQAVAGIQSGITDQLSVDEDAIKVQNPVELDSSNILTEIARVYAAIPTQVINEGEYEPEKAAVKIFMNANTYRFLRMALSTVPTAQQVLLPSFSIVDGKIYYMGVECVVVGLPDNTMIAASRDNLVFLTDLLSDTSYIKTAMGAELKNENIWYAKGQYRAKAGYIFADEVVFYQKTR